MNPLFCLFTLLFSFLLSAQSSGDKIREANKAYQNSKYQESGLAYDQAFKLEAGTPTDYYNAACSWALAGNSTKAIAYLQQSVNAGWKNVKHLQSDSDLASLHDLKEWSQIVEQSEANLADYEKDLNLPLKNQLEDIMVRDQTLRQIYKEAQNKFGEESEEMDYFWDLMAREDRINEQEVIEIIDEYGWVGTSEVGGKANMALWLVIQHAPIDLQEQYLPLLQESVMKGESSGSHLALLEDRILMRNDKPQTYGSQVVKDENTGDYIIYEVKDPEYVDVRRKSVGLGPLKDYANRMGASWNVPQKEK